MTPYNLHLRENYAHISHTDTIVYLSYPKRIIMSPAHSRWLPLRHFENIDHTYRNVGTTQANIVNVRKQI